MAEGFFEFRERLARKPGKPVKPPPLASAAMTVSQLTRQIERVLKDNLPASVTVKGEVSNFNAHAGSGHFYFTLKDAESSIDCVMFRPDAARVKFRPDDGMELLTTGRIGVYAQRGRYQLYVTSLQPIGQGALELAFQQLRAKLEKQGLFAAKRKKPLPLYPRRIAIVTAAQAAALQDMLKVLRRFPWLKIFIYPVPVQGEGSADKIACAIRHLNKRARDIGGLDVILLGRGGGSLEDLWAFNEEAVAKAIAASKIPIVTGIGHEVDVSIADLVADHHAHTPTEAAQVVTVNWRSAGEAITLGRTRLNRYLRDQVRGFRHRLNSLRRHEFFRRPMDRVNSLRQVLDDRQRALRLAMTSRLREQRRDLRDFERALNARHPRHTLRLYREQLAGLAHRLRSDAIVKHRRRLERLESRERELHAISPQAVLRRGYSMTMLKKDGAVIRSASQIKGGEKLLTRLADGIVESTADDPKQPKLFE